MEIGVLSLQGDFKNHIDILKELDVDVKEVRYSDDLSSVDGLIIPGGESTAISKQIHRNNFRPKLAEFVKKKPVFGTCAGMILLSSSNKKNLEELSVMDFDLDRNAYGAQINSFSDNILLNFDKDKKFHGFFIRAPKVSRIGSNVEVIATFKNEPVMLTDGMHYVTSFHPEIGNDYRIHEYIIKNSNA